MRFNPRTVSSMINDQITDHAVSRGWGSALDAGIARIFKFFKLPYIRRVNPIIRRWQPKYNNKVLKLINLLWKKRCTQKKERNENSISHPRVRDFPKVRASERGTVLPSSFSYLLCARWFPPRFPTALTSPFDTHKTNEFLVLDPLSTKTSR